MLKWKGAPIGSIKNTWRKACKRAELTGNVTPYSIRHTMARHLRASGVESWDVAAQLGHRMQGFGMTERYAAYSPDYLVDSAKALEAYLQDVMRV